MRAGAEKRRPLPFLNSSRPLPDRNGDGVSRASDYPAATLLSETLFEQLQDILHAERQLVKALPKMAKAARTPDLEGCFEDHLAETQTQVERLTEMFRLLGHKAKAKPCKGMAGLIAEGEELIEESAEKDDFAADLGLIAAAQKVEHYEMSAYLAARTLASQAGIIDVARLLGETLLEEERADKLLNRIAVLLMETAGKAPVAAVGEEREAEEYETEEVES